MQAGSEPGPARDLRVGRHAGRSHAWLVGLATGLAALVLYALTAARGAEWQDSGFHQYRIITGQLEHPLGLALSHPLHYWLGRFACAIPGGDPLLRINLVSALCGAVGIGVLAGLVARLGRSRAAGLLAGAAAGLAHSFWQMSALTETYTLAAALMVIEWALLLRFVRTQRVGWLIAVFAVNGLHVADHMLGSLTAVTYAVLMVERVVRRRVAWQWVPVAVVVWCLAASPYLVPIVEHYQRTGDVIGTVHSALFGAGGGATSQGFTSEVFNTSMSGGQLKRAVLTFGYCFPSATVLIALVGLWRRARGRWRMFRYVLLAQTVIIFAFVARYRIVDLYTYFVPVCALTGLWFGLGVARLLRRCPRPRGRRWLTAGLVVNALLPVAVYIVFPRVAEARGWLRGQMRDLPFRNEYEHFFQPWRRWDDSPERFAEMALKAAGPDGWLLADSTTAPMTAAVQAVRGSEAGVRVYMGRLCLSGQERPSLTDADLLAFVQEGGVVIAVPSAELRAIVPATLEIEDEPPLWRLRLPAR